MADKVRVYGKSMKWTAMGIIDAYVTMYPQSTLDDLNKAFPRKKMFGEDGKLLESVAQLKKMAAATETDFDDNVVKDMEEHQWYVTLSDGTKVSFYNIMWTNNNFPKLVEYAKLYDVVIADFQKAEKGIGKRGEYSLEYLNGYIPPKRKSNKILPLLLGIIGLVIVGLIIALLCRPKAEVVEVEKVVTVVDTVYVQQIEEMEDNFNAAQFQQGKTELNDDAKYVLHDLANLMKKNPGIKLRIVGHTSAEGNAAFNQKLSEARAKAAVDLLISKGVEENRLEYKGMGSSQLKDPENPTSEVNRRTEFEVVE